jgi:proteasome lid subunit RPN8/RPN11
MKFFKKTKSKERIIPKKWKITKKCLELICECSKSEYPNEFGGLLRVDPDKKDIIDELVILPGTVSGESHAIFRMHMKPVDFNIVGTVHSHPSRSPNPSSADLQLFQKNGKIHIIIAYPYDFSSWKAFYIDGTEIDINII